MKMNGYVSVKRAVRERSIPLEPSECDKVNVGDLVLCFREAENQALYGDAYIVEIERKLHDSNGCTCVFVVRYDFDNIEGRVTLDKICCRPTQSASIPSVAMEARWNVEGVVAVAKTRIEP
ncbi:hypothetical protein BUALT_Bualt07G0148700 [Buddleja alternifolia]|uniref:SAWADEE domain-containing protein n=1 Tax=Buddleja alternifolia TaxID=168488 RepID=A0AAV6XA94_9LAMI|nr:hypothetical protein BUALT_Bualt07G0148700 [Buddleja alternifolia]